MPHESGPTLEFMKVLKFSNSRWKKKVLHSRKFYLKKTTYFAALFVQAKLSLLKHWCDWEQQHVLVVTYRLQYIIGQKEHHKLLATNHKGIWRPKNNFTKAKVPKTN